MVPPQTAGTPLHPHDFDEAFYLLEGARMFQLEDALATRAAGERRAFVCQLNAGKPR